MLCRKCMIQVTTAQSVLLHPISATDFLPIEFALDVWCDPEFSGVPEAIHLTGEVFGELR